MSFSHFVLGERVYCELVSITAMYFYGVASKGVGGIHHVDVYPIMVTIILHSLSCFYTSVGGVVAVGGPRAQCSDKNFVSPFFCEHCFNRCFLESW